jgi:DtxR family Mn-dependent transcriptional regulator
MLTQAIQDYLKTIYKLQNTGPVATTELARELCISGASVTGMLKRLAGMKLVDYNSYKGVKLTPAGEKIALEIIRHHRLLELYLKEILGYSIDKVHDEACRLEHHISEEFGDKIDVLLGNPKFDPHGHPIPSKDGSLPDYSDLPLSEIPVGKNVVIRRISDHNAELLAYLESIKLVPNTNLKVVEKSPFNGPITISYNNDKKIIGTEVAGNIFVEERSRAEN